MRLAETAGILRRCVWPYLLRGMHYSPPQIGKHVAAVQDLVGPGWKVGSTDTCRERGAWVWASERYALSSPARVVGVIWDGSKERENKKREEKDRFTYCKEDVVATLTHISYDRWGTKGSCQAGRDWRKTEKGRGEKSQALALQLWTCSACQRYSLCQCVPQRILLGLPISNPGQEKRRRLEEEQAAEAEKARFEKVWGPSWRIKRPSVLARNVFSVSSESKTSRMAHSVRGSPCKNACNLEQMEPLIWPVKEEIEKWRNQTDPSHPSFNFFRRPRPCANASRRAFKLSANSRHSRWRP